MSALTHILYVEDDLDIQTIGKMVLEVVGGFNVTCCHSGELALSTLKTGDFQLVLLDVMMPGMDGPTTLKHMRATEKGATIPVVFITAKVQKAELDAYMEMGVLGTIRKPFDPMTLADDIHNFWVKHTANQKADV